MRQQEAQVKTGTKCHLRLHKILEEMGFQVLDEALFGRYSLDCYVPEIHIGFEADGKHWHSKKHDSERDAWLFEQFNLPVCRLKDSVLIPISKESLVKEMIQEFIDAQPIDDNRKAFAVHQFEPVGRELKSFEAPWKGVKRTDETKKLMSVSAKKRALDYPASVRNHCQPHSEEVKQEMSKKRLAYYVEGNKPGNTGHQKWPRETRSCKECGTSFEVPCVSSQEFHKKGCATAYRNKHATSETRAKNVAHLNKVRRCRGVKTNGIQ